MKQSFYIILKNVDNIPYPNELYKDAI